MSDMIVATRLSKLLRSWKRMQVSYYGGKYSIHRMLALEAYTKKTSPLRAFLVCIGTPLPMAALILIQESLPLRDPRDGWSANYGQWIRVTMLTFVITYTSTSPVGYFIDGIVFSLRQLVVLSTCVSVLISVCTMIVSAYLIFPIPFSVLTMTPIYNILYIVSFRIVMGAEIIQRTKERPEQFKQYMNFLHAQILLMFVYPVYEVLFRFAKGTHYQLLVILLLPVIKVLIKNIMRRCTMHAEDMVPEAVIFTVDFFNAVYVATCMQTASSTLSIVTITITDLSQTIIMLYGLHCRTATISSRLVHTIQTSAETESQDTFLSALSSVCRNSDKFKKQVRDNIRIRSCFPHALLPADANLLDTLDATSKEARTVRSHDSAAVIPYRGTSGVASRANMSPRTSCCNCNWGHSVHHVPPNTANIQGPVLPEGIRAPKNINSYHQKTTDNPAFLRDSLEALFTIECLVVTSYLEAVIPMFYTAYIMAMVHLSSAKYHTEMTGVTLENVGSTVFPVFVFGLLQIASFIILVVMVQHNGRLRALYQLAFVLESQKSLIQSKLIVWMMITLCFRVMHFVLQKLQQYLVSILRSNSLVSDISSHRQAISGSFCENGNSRLTRAITTCIHNLHTLASTGKKYGPEASIEYVLYGGLHVRKYSGDRLFLEGNNGLNVSQHLGLQVMVATTMMHSITTKGLVLLHAWKRLQVSYYGGKYSIHRLLALEAYSQRASVLRSLVVCIGIPLPMFVLVFVQEAVPLQDPREGWRANYGFWIRVVILTFVITHFSTGQAVYFIDGFSISTHRLLLLSASVSTIFTLCTIPIGANLIFPLPFSILTMTPIFNILHILLFRLIVGGRIIRQLLAQREQLIKYMDFLYAQILMMFVYPVYELLFRYAEGSRYQLFVILLLPVIKVLIKNIVLRCTAHAEDLTPESVIFTVDFFNSMYVATCMQSASSAFSISAITFTDLAQTLIMLYGLHRRTITILPRLNQTVHAAPGIETPGIETADNLLSVVCFLCQSSEKLDSQDRTNVRIRSCVPHELSAINASLLSKLNKTNQSLDSTAVLPFRKTSSVSSLDKVSVPRKLCVICTNRSNSIHPRSDTAELVTLTITAGVNDTRPRDFESLRSHSNILRGDSTILLESLEVVFTIECLVVTAYLEVVIPFFYTAYILVMVHLPSAQYHAEMNDVTQENVGSTVLPVFVFGLLQLVSFLMLMLVIKRNCGMQALYQLTFVLEAQRSSIQGKLMIWMVITLCFRVVHFGVDFTFKFAGLGYHF